jgi:hypothetical protein
MQLSPVILDPYRFKPIRIHGISIFTGSPVSVSPEMSKRICRSWILSIGGSLAVMVMTYTIFPIRVETRFESASGIRGYSGWTRLWICYPGKCLRDHPYLPRWMVFSRIASAPLLLVSHIILYFASMKGNIAKKNGWHFLQYNAIYIISFCKPINCQYIIR